MPIDASAPAGRPSTIRASVSAGARNGAVVRENPNPRVPELPHPKITKEP